MRCADARCTPRVQARSRICHSRGHVQPRVARACVFAQTVLHAAPHTRDAPCVWLPQGREADGGAGAAARCGWRGDAFAVLTAPNGGGGGGAQGGWPGRRQGRR
eukprot:2122612-Prymnesium_polylepis.1